MTKKQLTEYTDEELNSQFKKAKTLGSIFAGLIIAMIVLSVFTVYSKKVSFSTYLPLFFLPLLFVFISQIKAIKKEITSRK